MELADSSETDEEWAKRDDVVEWNNQGIALAHRLRGELGSAVEIEYYDYISGKDVAF